MPKIEANATVTTTQDIHLSPKVRAKLLKELRAYQALKAQRNAIDEQMDKHKAAIGGLRDDTGEMSITLEGFTTTLVAGTYKKFNPKLFVSLGGDLELYNQAIEEKPKKPFEKVTCPGDRSRGDDE